MTQRKLCAYCCEIQLRADNKNPDGVCGHCAKILHSPYTKSPTYQAWLAAGKPVKTSGWTPPASRWRDSAMARKANGVPKPTPTPKPAPKAAPTLHARSVDELRKVIKAGRDAKHELDRRLGEAQRRLREARSLVRSLQ